MAMSMPSEELQLLIAGYVLGDLSPEEAAEFERLVALDPAIAAEVAQLQTVLETVYAPTEVTPPPVVRSQLLAQAEAEQTEPAVPAIVPRAARRRVSMRTVIEIAAAALIAALGLNNYRLSQALQLSQAETQHYAALTYELQSTSPNQRASAKVVVNPKTLAGTLAVQHLPPLPPGKVYVLWTVLQPAAPFTKDPKGAVLTQVFHVDAHGQVQQDIVLPAAFRTQAQVTKVAVTVEDAHAPQQHVGQPIMVAQL